MTKARGIRRGGLLTAFAATVALAMPAAASAATATVNDDVAGPGPTGSTCATPDFTTIQAALDAAGGAADTINVCAGTYSEGLTVDADHVTLRGAGAGVDARTRAATAESLVDLPNGNGVGLDVNADDFTLDGFTLTDSNGTAVRLTGGAGHTLVNDVISDTGSGVFLVGTDGGTDTFRHDFLDSNSRNPGLGDGIQTSGVYGAELEIDENAFRGHDSTAIGLQSATSGAEITGNATDGDATFVVVQNTTGALIAGNAVDGAAGTAVYFANGNTDVVVRGNSINGLDGGPSPSSGVRFASAFGAVPANQNIDVVGNSITGRSAGIRIDDGMHAGVLDVHFNRIAGNATGIRDEDDDPGHSVDAADNWWGCDEGPGADGCDVVTGTALASVTAAPRLVLGVAPARSSLLTGEATTVQAGLTRNSAGETPSANVFPPTAVGFTATLGSVDPVATTGAGMAGAAFRAGPAPGSSTITATLDNESASAQISILERTVPPPPPPTPPDEGTTGDDDIDGTTGDDEIAGLGGDDRLAGGEGDDSLDGGAGADTLKGGSGNDRLKGGKGKDRLVGGSGADVIVATDGQRDIVSCGPGRDRVKSDGKDRVAKDCERLS